MLCDCGRPERSAGRGQCKAGDPDDPSGISGASFHEKTGRSVLSEGGESGAGGGGQQKPAEGVGDSGSDGLCQSPLWLRR